MGRNKRGGGGGSGNRTGFFAALRMTGQRAGAATRLSGEALRL